MMYLIVILFIVLAIVFWQLNSSKQYNFVAIFHGLATIGALFLIGVDISDVEGESIPTSLLIPSALSVILVANMVFSHFWKKKSAYWPPIFILISSLAVVYSLNKLFDYNGFQIDLTAISIAILPFLGSLIEPIATMKENVLAKFFKIDFKSRRGISRSIYFFLIGALLLFAHFVGSYIGVAMLTIGYAASLFYGKKSSALWNMLLALLAISTLGHFAIESNITESSLLLGRVLAGVFFSGFIALFVNTMQKARKNKTLGVILCWFLMLFLPSILILAVTQNINFGGGDAFLGLLVGFSLSAAYGINTRKNDTVLSLYFVLGILLLPLTINKEEEQMTKITVSNGSEAKVEDPFELEGKEITLTGEYKIVTENSQLTFELGQVGGRTKGAFKSFEGTFTFGDAHKLNVSLPVKSLTTFNSYRDESLMEEAYFDESEFPSMSFESTSFTANNTGYEVVGKFTMLGQTRDLVMQMKYLGKSDENSNEVFIGKSSLNRVDFGMKSDPKEGNIVDFQFKVELAK